MGDINQLLYLKHFVQQVDGAVLEIGSKDYGSTAPFREHLTYTEYIGLDLSEGKGVDVVGDLTQGLCGLPENHFALVICCSVLEHTNKPWRMAEHIARLTKPEGRLFMSVPWVWRYHPYPDDYFRFSHRGVAALFGDFTWQQRHYSTTVQGEFVEITEQNAGADNQLAVMLDTGKGGKRKYLPYLMVNMLGAKK